MSLLLTFPFFFFFCVSVSATRLYLPGRSLEGPQTRVGQRHVGADAPEFFLLLFFMPGHSPRRRRRLEQMSPVRRWQRRWRRPRPDAVRRSHKDARVEDRGVCFSPLSWEAAVF